MTDQHLEERVARQLCEASNPTLDPDTLIGHSKPTFRAWEGWLPNARAVIATVLGALSDPNVVHQNMLRRRRRRSVRAVRSHYHDKLSQSADRRFSRGFLEGCHRAKLLGRAIEA